MKQQRVTVVTHDREEEPYDDVLDVKVMEGVLVLIMLDTTVTYPLHAVFKAVAESVEV
ncbi:MAG: hypothetical protein V4510_12805 [bacterium]